MRGIFLFAPGIVAGGNFFWADVLQKKLFGIFFQKALIFFSFTPHLGGHYSFFLLRADIDFEPPGFRYFPCNLCCIFKNSEMLKEPEITWDSFFLDAYFPLYWKYEEGSKFCKNLEKLLFYFVC